MLAIVMGGACSSSSGTPATNPSTTGIQSLWIAPTTLAQLTDTHFYDHPWPSDLRRDPDGSIHVVGFYNPHLVPLLSTIINQTQGLLPGFSPT